MKIKFLLTLLLAAFCQIACAQPEINIEREANILGGTKPILISVAGLTGEAAEVLQFDLTVQGFKIAPAADAQFEVTGATKTYYNTITDLQGAVLVLEKTVMSLDGEKETLVSGKIEAELSDSMHDEVVQVEGQDLRVVLIKA